MTNLSVLDLTPDADLLFLKKGGDALIVQVKELTASLPKDAKTPENRALLKTVASKLRSLKNRVDEAGKALNDDAAKRIKEVNNERNRIWDAIEKEEKDGRQPLTDWENIEKARVKKHEDDLAELTAINNMTHNHIPAEAINDRLGEIVKAFEGKDWEEYEAQGVNAYVAAKATLKEAFDVRTAFEKEQKDMEDYRAQKAKDEEKAGAEAQKEIDDKRVADALAKKEADAKAAEELRAKDRKHKGAIHKAIVEKLVAAGKVDGETAKGIVTLIAQGLIPNVKITY